MRCRDAQQSLLSVLYSAFVLSALAAVACDPSPAEPEIAPQSSTVQGAPGRIVSTMPSTTEMLHAIGVWDRVVGVSRFCDVPSAASQLPRVGSGMDPDLERLLSLRPDLVVGTVAQNGFPFVSALEAAGIPVFLVTDQSLDEMYDGLLALGREVGAVEAAQREVARIRAELETISLTVEGLEPPRVLVVHDRDPVYAAGRDTLVSHLIEVAGGRNVLERGDWVQLDREQVLRLAPDVIFEPGELGEAALLDAWAPLQTVPAVRQGRIYSLRSHGISRPGPGAPAAAREIAEYLFPGRFASGDP